MAAANLAAQGTPQPQVFLGKTGNQVLCPSILYIDICGTRAHLKSLSSKPANSCLLVGSQVTHSHPAAEGPEACQS